jgi:phytoene synthase|tara:strand:- start:5064 stop:5957 length:894 start_codon:yes stop_codon:yes gene_type:complete
VAGAQLEEGGGAMSRDTNFYYSFLALPAEKRRAIIAVWDFCRAVDDAVDEPAVSGSSGTPDAVAAAVERWRSEVAACFDGRAPHTAEGERLQPFIDRFGLPREAFEQLVDGVEMDVGNRRYETFADLREYCLRVASGVGLMTIEIFGYRDAKVKDYAIDLGVALQLTNIIRDVAVDLTQGRVYLPLKDLERFGCTEDDLRRGELSPRVVALLKHQCDRAREYYARARAALPRGEARRLVAAEIMGAIYFAILEAIEGAGYDVFSRVIRVPRPRRAMIAASTWVKTMVHVGDAGHVGP